MLNKDIEEEISVGFKEISEYRNELVDAPKPNFNNPILLLLGIGLAVSLLWGFFSLFKK